MKGIVIEGANMPPLRLENCTQTITHQGQDHLRRTVNGVMKATALDTSIRYATTIQCAGAALPSLGGMHVGQRVRIQSIQRLWQTGQKDGLSLARPAVSGSVLVLNSQNEVIPHDQIGNQIIPQFLGRPYFVGYCPILTACVVDVTMTCGMGGLDQVWMLTAEETL